MIATVNSTSLKKFIWRSKSQINNNQENHLGKTNAEKIFRNQQVSYTQSKLAWEETIFILTSQILRRCDTSLVYALQIISIKLANADFSV